MSELDDLLKSLGRSTDNAIPDTPPVVEEEEDETSSPEIPAELNDLIKRVNENSETPVITDVTGDTETGLTPLPGGNLGVDVTDEVQAAQNPTRDFDFIYGEKPSYGPLTRIPAAIYDMLNTGTPNATQQQRDEAKVALDNWQANANEIYDAAEEIDLPQAELLGIDITGLSDDELFSDGKVKVYQYIGEDGNIENVLLPNPNSNSFERIVDQAGRTIFSEIYGLVERDDDGSLQVNYAAEDSTYAQGVPDYDQGAGAGLATDLLVFGLPGVGAQKAGKGVVGVATGLAKKADNVIGSSKIADKARRIGSVTDNALQYTGGSIAVALTEGVLSQGGDEGMIVDPEWVKSRFTALNDQEAADVAMIMDGFVVNGGFDLILGLGSMAGRFVGKKSEGAYGLVSKEFVKNKAQRSALMGVLFEIDPALKDMSKNELVESMRNLSNTLNKNSKGLAVVGKTTKEIDLDTTNALLNGASDYIRVSHRKMKKGMTNDQWEQYIKDQSNLMVNRVVGLAQANMDNAGLRNQQASMLEQMSGAFTEEANRVNPKGVDFNTETVPELVESRQVNIDEAQAEADVATARAENLRAEAGRAVENDPLIKAMIADVDPTRFFNDEEYVAELTRVFGDEFVQSNRRQWDAVNAAYEAIPNDPVDFNAFKTKLSNIFNTAGGLGSVNSDSAPIINKIKQVFKDKLVSKTDDLNLADPRDVVPDLQTPQQVIDAITDNLGYQDLVKLKREIDGLVKNAGNADVAQALAELRQHILSAEVGGQAAYVARNGGEAAELVKKADDLFIDTKSRLDNSFTTSKMTDLANEPSYAGANTRVPDGGDVRGMPDMKTEVVRDVLPQATSDVTGSQMDQLRFALSQDLARGEVNKPILDLFVARQTDRLAKALDANDAQTIAEIDNAFEGIITELKNLEAMDLVTDLEDAKRRILSVQGELGDSALAADEVAAMALERKRMAEESIVGNLESSINRGNAKTTPTKTIKTALLGDDAGNYIDALLGAIDELPEAKRGPALQATQSMLLRQVREVLSTNSMISPTARDVSMPKIMDLTDPERSGMLEAVAKAFPNDPYLQETLTVTLGSMGDVSLAQRMKVARGQSQTAANLGIRDSVSTGILFAFGYMNPTAAAARRITAGQIEAMEQLSKQEQSKIIATVLAAPEEFADLTKKIADGIDPSMLAKSRDLFLQSANRTVQYEIRVDEEGDDSSFFLDMITGASNAASSVADWLK